MERSELARLLAKIQRLEDERNIQSTMHLYAHALDYGWEAEFMDCWVEEAELEWSTFPESFRGKDAIRRAFHTHTHAPDVLHKHFMVAPLIRIDGDRAEVRSLFTRLDQYDGMPQVRIYGHYTDRLVRCPDGRWRFSQRKAHKESLRAGSPDQIAPSATTSPPPKPFRGDAQ